MGNPSSEPTVTPEDQRYELQGLLGEYHGLLTTIVHGLRELSQLLEINDLEIKDLLATVDNAFPGVSVAFGEVQGGLNTGGHDAGLEEVGLTSEQFKPKLRGFRFNLKRFYAAIANLPETIRSPQWRADFIRAAKHAIRGVKWGNIAIGSLSKELGKFKGAEVIREFGEVIVTTLEQIVDEPKATG